MKRLSFILRIILVLNVLAVVALAIAVSAQWVSPRVGWVPAFVGLGFPVILVVNVLFVIFWLLVRKWWWLMSLVAILLGIVVFTNYVALRPFANNHIGEGYRILSYNVRNFDLYNWSHNEESRNRIVGIVRDQEPDIVCFQDFYHEAAGGFITMEGLSEAFDLPYHRFGETLALRGTDRWGMAIFSRFPIVSSRFIHFEGTKLNGMLVADIQLDSLTVSVINVHLQSLHFNPDELAAFDEGYRRSSWKIARSLRYGFKKRAEQTRLVAEAIKQSEHPVIVCGDFNDTPVSYAYGTISKGLNDAFIKKGVGLGTTYAGSLPGLRIDYILMSKSFEILGFRRIKEGVSDHYPVVASFR